MIALCCTDRTGSEIRLLRHFSERLRAEETIADALERAYKDLARAPR